MSKTVFVANQNEEIEEAFSLSENEEIIIKKKDKQLTNKQKKLINQKQDLKRFCNKQGGFVHMFYVNSKLLFYDLDIDRANIARIIYLATYIDYNDRQANLLIKYSKNHTIQPMTREEMKKVLNLSKSIFESFLTEMKKNELIFEADNKFYINPKYFSKGKEKGDKSYTRLFISNTRYLYENCTARQHKTLSYIYQLVPYTSYELNILCRNPLEKDFTKLKKLTCKEICEILSISTNKKSMYKFRESLKKFYIKVDGRKYYFISYVTVKNAYGIKDYFVINPNCIWSGSNVEENRRTLSYLFF